MPKKMRKSNSGGVKQTPMMKQYLDQKGLYPDCILFFRLGDFYEMFFEDAEVAAGVLDIALTSRSKDKNGYPMCGVPYFSANAYIAKLVDRGYKVAVCDQVEDAKQAKGIVKRAVTRVVSPGMITDPEDLDSRQSNYLAGAAPLDDGGLGFSFLDVSTADFRWTRVVGEAGLLDELARVAPRELLLPAAWEQGSLAQEIARRFGRLFIKFTDLAGEKEQDGGREFDTRFDEALAVGPEDISAADAEAARRVFAYARASLPGSLDHVRRLVYYRVSDHLIVDEFSRANLELTRTLMEGQRRGSLLALIDRTRSPMGTRLLTSWLLFPLVSVDGIRARADAVEQLVQDAVLREDLQGLLGDMRDLERLLAKVSVGQATPRDLGALRDSVGRLPSWSERLLAAGAERPLCLLLGELDGLADLHLTLDRVLVDEPPADLSNGGAVRGGVDARLDEVVHLATSGRDTIAQLEQEERERTGIGSLKIKYNKVFGYYVEVTKPNLHLVPAHYRRKQTTANAERYDTEELKLLEERILSAHEDRVALERALMIDLADRVCAEGARILRVAAQVAQSDVIAGLAELAASAGYCRPLVNDSDVIDIEEGRHPVVEKLMTGERFVPNDIRVDGRDQQLLIITGPNMAGKSTTIRQVAAIVILAQMGAFVPASAATIGLVDRIFTRIGAADNLARGQSTFMVEMTEAAHILRNASRQSLIILDEIGRGTSTFDGLSIAWAVAEYIHDRIGARTLFATHYHQLSELALIKERAANFTVSVKEWNDQIIFLRRLVAGISSRSYGIQVGKLAGLPEEVIRRAKEVLANLEGQEFDELGTPRLSAGQTGRPKRPATSQLSLFATQKRSRLEEELGALELDVLSPLEALNLLHRWKGELP